MVAPGSWSTSSIYSELAKSFAADGDFAVRDVPTTRLRVRLPAADRARLRALRLAPGRLRGGEGDQRARDVARRGPGLPPRAPLLASRPRAPRGAVLTVAVPSMVYTGTLMTENAFYPLFLLVALALVRVLERPTPRGAGARCSRCSRSRSRRARRRSRSCRRSLTAPLLLALLERAARATLGRTAARTASSAAAACSWSSLAGWRAAASLSEPARRLRGRRRARATTSATVLHFSLYHVAELDLYLGVLPFAALLVLSRRSAARRRALAGVRRRDARARRWLLRRGRGLRVAASPTGSRSATCSTSRRCS